MRNIHLRSRMYFSVAYYILPTGLSYRLHPAVTIALLVTGKIRAKEAGLFIACQILGAVIGAAVVYSMFGGASLTLPECY